MLEWVLPEGALLDDVRECNGQVSLAAATCIGQESPRSHLLCPAQISGGYQLALWQLRDDVRETNCQVRAANCSFAPASSGTRQPSISPAACLLCCGCLTSSLIC